MSPIALMTLSLALVCGAFYAVLLARPEQVRALMGRFPRSVWPARLLTGLDLLWVVIVMHRADFGGFNWIKELPLRYLPFLKVLSGGPFAFLQDPVVWVGLLAFFLIIRYLDELLAPRALGGLMLLIANPILNAARWLDTHWRWVMAVVAYAIVVKGMILVLSPFRFRKWTERFLNTDQQCRRWALAGLVFNAFLLLLALLAY